MEEEARELREKEIEEKWRKMILYKEIEKSFMIEQLTESAHIRAHRGKKKKRKGKKGGKKK